MRTKAITLVSGAYEKWSWAIALTMTEQGYFRGKSNLHFRPNNKYSNEQRAKKHIREADGDWVRFNIPSSIWWFTEIHHDWEDGGRMYLLAKAEHILRHRREKSR